MKSKKATKRALLSSALSLVLCFSMLLGTTFAWFTDSASTAVNTIQSGTLDVDLVDENGYTLVGQTLGFLNSKNESQILWEPGCTFVSEGFRIVNKGNLALKYKLAITGINGNAELLDVIDFWLVKTKPNADNWNTMEKFSLDEENKLNPEGKNLINDVNFESNLYYLVGHMDEDANNDYQGKTLDGVGITVYATQVEAEVDSFDEKYDADATYNPDYWSGIVPTSLEGTTLEIVPGGGTKTGTITINSAEDLVYLTKLAADWVGLFSNGDGTDVTCYRESEDGKGTDYYYHWQWTVELATDLDMSNIPMDSVDISYWGTFNGNDHTISNVAMKDGQDGLFNNGAKAINNLTVKNIIVNAPEAKTVGAVAGNAVMNNVHVVNATVTGGKYVGGICGQGSNFTNCSIKNSTVTGTDKTVGGLVGYSIGDPGAATVTGNTVENVTVTGAYNVGGLLGQSQNETVENNTVKNVTVISTTALPDGASSNEVRTAEVAARSAFDNTTIGTNTVVDCETVELVYGLKVVPNDGAKTGTITVSDAEGLLNLTKLAADWVRLFSNGEGTDVTCYRESEGGKGTDYYYHWQWTVELAADLDMSNIPMDSVDISYWGTFDGNDHTISNVVMKDGQDGLFNNGAKAINDLTVKNITVNAPEADTVGAVAGNAVMTNVHVVNATVTGGKYVGGICGKGSNFTNCSIKNSTVTGTDKTVGGLVGYSIGDPSAATVTGNTVENVTVTGAYNVGGLLGQSQNETVENNTVKNVTVISTTALPEGASSNEVRTAEVAARSAFDNTTIGTNTVENVTLLSLEY